MRFRSLAYFRDYENESEAEAVRKDDKEGNLVFGPPEGLLVSNQTIIRPPCKTSGKNMSTTRLPSLCIF